MVRSTISIGASGRNVAIGTSTMRATSAGAAVSSGRRSATRQDRRHREVADRDPVQVERPDDPDAGGVGIETDLLGRLAERGGGQVGVAGLGLAAREADLARVVRRPTVRSIRTTRAIAGVIRIQECEDRGRPPGATGRQPAAGSRIVPADHDRHEHVRRRRQGIGQSREPLEDRVEAHALARPAS